MVGHTPHTKRKRLYIYKPQCATIKLLAKRYQHRRRDKLRPPPFPFRNRPDTNTSNVAPPLPVLPQGRPGGVPMIICGLARAREQDIERCVAAVEAAPQHRVHTFLATSDIHLEHKLQITRAEALRQIADKVRCSSPGCQQA